MFLESLCRFALGLLINCVLLRLSFIVKRGEQIRNHINSGKTYRLHLRTQDLKFSRALEFSPAGFKKVKANHGEKSLEVEFESAKTAMKLFLKANAKHFMRAMKSQQLKINGDLSSIPWFARLGKLMLPEKQP